MRPEAVNRLIALDSKIKRKGLGGIKAEEIVSAISKIMSALSKEDKAEARALAADVGFPIYF